MADLSQQEHTELIENRTLRDKRFATIERALDIETELQKSPTWRFIMEKIETEKGDIAAALAGLDPSNIGDVAKLQARAISAASIPDWIAGLIIDASVAEHEINAEDGRLPADQ